MCLPVVSQNLFLLLYRVFSTVDSCVDVINRLNDAEELREIYIIAAYVWFS